MLESLFNKVVGLKVCNFVEEKPQHKCFPVDILKLRPTTLLKRDSKSPKQLFSCEYCKHLKINMQEWKCKIRRKYTAQNRTEAWPHNLCGQILDSILSHVDSVTYVHNANVYNPVLQVRVSQWLNTTFHLLPPIFIM